MDNQAGNRFDFLVNDAYHRRMKEIATNRIAGLNGQLPENYVQPTAGWNSAASGENLVNAMAMIFASANQNKAAAIEKLNQVADIFEKRIEQIRGAISYAKVEFKSEESLALVGEFEDGFESEVVPGITSFLAQYGKLMSKGKVAKAEKYWNDNTILPGALVRSYEKGGMLISFCDLISESYKYFNTNQKFLKLEDWFEDQETSDKNLLKAITYLFDEIDAFENQLDVAISKIPDIYHDSIVDFTRLEKSFGSIKKDVNSLATQIK